MLLPAVAQTTFDAPTIAQRADQWIKAYVATGDFSGVVLMAQGDRILFERAYGKADFQNDVANQIGTRFRIASLSKTFTAAAIELLIAQGKLSLKDHLSKYVSGVANGDQITVEQLLTHESGVGQLDAADMYRDCLSNEELIRPCCGNLQDPRPESGAHCAASTCRRPLTAQLLPLARGAGTPAF